MSAQIVNRKIPQRPGETLKYCPRCGSERFRVSYRRGPYTYEECAGWERRHPRKSARYTLWNRFLWLVAPIDYTRWYLNIIVARCSPCKTNDRVEFARPLGKFRLLRDRLKKNQNLRPAFLALCRLRRMLFRLRKFRLTADSIRRSVSWWWKVVVAIARTQF